MIKTFCSFIYFTIALILFGSVLRGQTQAEGEWSGTLITGNKQYYSFSLDISSEGNNQPVAKMLTYGEDFEIETMAKVLLENDSIQEIIEQIPEEVSVKNNEEQCYVHLSVASRNRIARKWVLGGPYTAYFANGKTCDTGEFILVKRKTSESVLKKIPEMALAAKTQAQSEDEDSSKGKTKPEEILEAPQELSANITGLYALSSPQNWLILSDFGDEDGDSVLVMIQGAQESSFVLGLSKQNQEFALPILKTKETLDVKITALNEGKAGKNTAFVALRGTDGKLSHTLSVDLFKGEFAVLRLYFNSDE